MTKAIVIGGGIIGTSTAFRLAQGGAQVTLLEMNWLASGTSSSSFAWMNSNNKAPREYHRLNLGGMTEHVSLQEEFGRSPWLHMDGNVIWDAPEDGGGANEPAVPVQGEPFAQKIQRLREWEYPVELLTPGELATIHPEIRPHLGVEQVAYFPTEGYIDVPLLVATLARAAEAHGAEIRTGQQVVEITRESDRVVGVRTASGDTFAADVVVSCSGRWTNQITELVGTTIPMAPTLGLLVVSEPVATTLRSLAHTGSVNLRPNGGSRILMASFEHDQLLEEDTSHQMLRNFAQEILRRATEILPDLEGSKVESLRVGTRSIPLDGFPVIGPVSTLEGLYVAATHSGVTMGPLIGRIVAKEILSGAVDDRILGFRPDRLLTVGSGASPSP